MNSGTLKKRRFQNFNVMRLLLTTIVTPLEGFKVGNKDLRVRHHDQRTCKATSHERYCRLKVEKTL